MHLQFDVVVKAEMKNLRRKILKLGLHGTILKNVDRRLIVNQKFYCGILDFGQKGCKTKMDVSQLSEGTVGISLIQQ